MPRTAAPPRTANAALSFHIERCPRRLPIASAVKYERPAIVSTAQSPTFTSHDVGAAALERVCAVVPHPQLKTSSAEAAAWICHPIISHTKAVGGSAASSDAATTAVPESEAARNRSWHCTRRIPFSSVHKKNATLRSILFGIDLRGAYVNS